MSDSPHHAPRGPEGVPLVSVVVPFYNLRDWAGHCMDSLLAQDFGSFEVVCVDDGSTDGTAELLDSYAPDPRVTVLHKANGGPSDARNFGVRHARGELVAFVDGDDFVAPNYLSALHGALSSTGAELAMCPCVAVPPERLGSFEWPAGGAPRVECMGSTSALSEVLSDRVPLSSWGRLAPREIYLDHPFPVGEIGEDVLMFRWHFMTFERFALVGEPLYVYVLRPGSITRSGRSPDEDWMHRWMKEIDCLESALADDPGAPGPSAAYCTARKLSILHNLIAYMRPRTDRMREVMAESRGRVRRLWPALRRDPEIGLVHKANFWVLVHAPWAHHALALAWWRVTRIIRR